MKIKNRLVLSLGFGVCLIVSSGYPLQADVKLPSIFGDHMVLQQEAKLPVWGTADSQEKITVTVGNHTATTTAGTDGTWRVDLLPFPNGTAPVTMKVQGKNTLTFQDILIGEVWVCSGQSNMELAMTAASNAQTEIPQAKDPQLRLFIVTKKLSLQPLTDLAGSWQLCTPETVKGFSAVGYFYGKELRADLKRPVGLIGTYWGGSTAQSWTSLSGLQKEPPFGRYLDLYKKNLADYDKLNDHYTDKQTAYTDALQKWTAAGNKTLYDAWRQQLNATRAAHQPDPHQTFPPMPTAPPLPGGDQKAPANLFNGMISPLLPFAIKGVIWYQGEYNADDPMEYYDLFPRLIKDWREKWAQGDFPFIFVQLPAIYVQGPPGTSKSDSWDIVREAQFKALALPNTGLAVSLDVGGHLHPPGKIYVGQRLALVARHQVYGESTLADSGPVYDSMKVEGNKIRVTFTQVNGGLTIGSSPMPDTAALQPKDKLSGFVIAGADKTWQEADAQIDGDTLIISSPQVTAPVAVRYGWGNGSFEAMCNLYNKDGLPAQPFRTDDWDDIVPAHAKLPPSPTTTSPLPKN